MTLPRAEDGPSGAWTVRRLEAGDSAAYQALRLEGFRSEPRAFRVAPEDEAHLTPDAVAAKLSQAYVVGGFDAHGLAGIGGLSRFEGAKLRHRGLLYGMYVRPAARGRGLADLIVAALLDEARRSGYAQVLLTVVAANQRACALYERHGFRRYGVEPRAIRVDDGYLDEALMVWQADG